MKIKGKLVSFNLKGIWNKDQIDNQISECEVELDCKELASQLTWQEIAELIDELNKRGINER